MYRSKLYSVVVRLESNFPSRRESDDTILSSVQRGEIPKATPVNVFCYIYTSQSCGPLSSTSGNSVPLAFLLPRYTPASGNCPCLCRRKSGLVAVLRTARTERNVTHPFSPQTQLLNPNERTIPIRVYIFGHAVVLIYSMETCCIPLASRDTRRRRSIALR